MAPRPTILAIVGPWKPPPEDQDGPYEGPDRVRLETGVREGLGRATDAPFRLSCHHHELVIDWLDVAGLIAVLEYACRGRDWACGVVLKPVPNPTMAALRTLSFARRSAWGVAVRRDRTDPTVAPVDAALGLHAAVLRGRREAAWNAIDAVTVHGTRCAAAQDLRCSPQAVSKQLRQNHYTATAAMPVILSALLAPGDDAR